MNYLMHCLMHGCNRAARTCQNDKIFHSISNRLLKQPKIASHCVTGALEPVGVLWTLTGCKNLHKTTANAVDRISLVTLKQTCVVDYDYYYCYCYYYYYYTTIFLIFLTIPQNWKSLSITDPIIIMVNTNRCLPESYLCCRITV